MFKYIGHHCDYFLWKLTKALVMSLRIYFPWIEVYNTFILVKLVFSYYEDNYHDN